MFGKKETKSSPKGPGSKAESQCEWWREWVGGELSTLRARRSGRHTTEATRDVDLRAVKALDQAAFLRAI